MSLSLVTCGECQTSTCQGTMAGQPACISDFKDVEKIVEIRFVLFLGTESNTPSLGRW